MVMAIDGLPDILSRSDGSINRELGHPADAVERLAIEGIADGHPQGRAVPRKWKCIEVLRPRLREHRQGGRGYLD